MVFNRELQEMWLLIYVFCSNFTLVLKKIHFIHVLLFKYSRTWIVATERSGREHISCGCVSASYCQPPPTDGSGIIDIRIVTKVKRLKVCFFFLNQDSPSYKSVRFRIEASCFGDRHRMKVFCRGMYCSQATSVIFVHLKPICPSLDKVCGGHNDKLLVKMFIPYAKQYYLLCLCPYCSYLINGKGKVFPLQARCGPEGG